MTASEYPRQSGGPGGGRAASTVSAPGRAARPTPRADGAVSIRTATASDLDTIVALRLALLREHAGNPVYGRLRADAPERARRLFASQLASPREVTYLAEHGARVVGILRCIESVGSPLLEPERYGYVASVYVVPELRRAGVLRALLDAAVAWCDRQGLEEMRLHSAADNVSGNAAWAALGFTVAEHLRVRPVRPGAVAPPPRPRHTR
jgi:ribosomal protein S18 acetylase RimI-like enzyme